jgi:TATA-binding protein-associated factor Taf7
VPTPDAYSLGDSRCTSLADAILGVQGQVFSLNARSEHQGDEGRDDDDEVEEEDDEEEQDRLQQERLLEERLKELLKELLEDEEDGMRPICSGCIILDVTHFLSSVSQSIQTS